MKQGWGVGRQETNTKQRRKAKKKGGEGGGMRQAAPRPRTFTARNQPNQVTARGAQKKRKENQRKEANTPTRRANPSPGRAKQSRRTKQPKER